jgi:hypothetical protein
MVELGDRWPNELGPPDFIQYVLHLYVIVFVMNVNPATVAAAQI